METEIPKSDDFLFVCSFLLWNFARVDGDLSSPEDSYLKHFIESIPNEKRSRIINRIKTVTEDEVISVVKKLNRIETVHLITNIIQIITIDGKVLKSELEALKELNNLIEGEWDIIKNLLSDNHNIDVDSILNDKSLPKENEIKLESKELKNEEYITCSECNSEIEAISIFCSFCGHKLTKTDIKEEVKTNKCPGCNIELVEGNIFCTECGYKLN